MQQLLLKQSNQCIVLCASDGVFMFFFCYQLYCFAIVTAHTHINTHTIFTQLQLFFNPLFSCFFFENIYALTYTYLLMYITLPRYCLCFSAFACRQLKLNYKKMEFELNEKNLICFVADCLAHKGMDIIFYKCMCAYVFFAYSILSCIQAVGE